MQILNIKMEICMQYLNVVFRRYIRVMHQTQKWNLGVRISGISSIQVFRISSRGLEDPFTTRLIFGLVRIIPDLVRFGSDSKTKNHKISGKNWFSFSSGSDSVVRVIYRLSRIKYQIIGWFRLKIGYFGLF